MDSIYQSPLLLDQQGLGAFITHRLRFPENPPQWGSWKKMLGDHLAQAKQVNIAICGKYAELADCYVSVNDALKDAGASAGAKVNLEWIETDDFEKQPEKVRLLSRFDGVLVPGGFGVRGAEGKIQAIEYSRSHDIPFLGICYGFQLAVVEYARHIGIVGAASSELKPGSRTPVIDLMPEQNGVLEKGGTMRLGAHEITVDEGTTAYSLYGKGKIWERHRHRYEVNPKYIAELTSKGLKFSGRSDANRRMEILEVPSSRFHFATQFHAEFKSRPARASPPYFGLIRAALQGGTPLVESKQVLPQANNIR
jgi:CTP synthase